MPIGDIYSCLCSLSYGITAIVLAPAPKAWSQQKIMLECSSARPTHRTGRKSVLQYSSTPLAGLEKTHEQCATLLDFLGVDLAVFATTARRAHGSDDSVRWVRGQMHILSTNKFVVSFLFFLFG